MLNSCFDRLYRILGLRGGGFYPYFVAMAVAGSNFSNLLRKPMWELTPSLKAVTKIESILFLVYPMTCILESRLWWARFRMEEAELDRIKGLVGSKTRYNKFILLQQILLLLYPSFTFFLKTDILDRMALLPVYIAYAINYSAVVRYSTVIWTIQDLFEHLNHRLEETLAYRKSCQAYAISRVCRIHKLLGEHAAELNGMFQIQMLVCLLLIIVRCLIYPSIVVMTWLDSQRCNKWHSYLRLGMIGIDLVLVSNIFHPPSMTVQQARNTCKILRSVVNKQLVDSDMVIFFLKKLMLQEVKFSLLDLVEQNELTIILVMQYITTRLFILMTF